VRLSVFERNVLQGGYWDVNRGRANRTGWNSIMGSVVISKSTNSARIMKNIIRCDDACNMKEGEGTVMWAEIIQHKKIISKNIFSDKQKQHIQ
jgi:hypothetical protein